MLLQEKPFHSPHLETAAFASGGVTRNLSHGKIVEGTAEQLYKKCGWASSPGEKK